MSVSTTRSISEKSAFIAGLSPTRVRPKASWRTRLRRFRFSSRSARRSAACVRAVRSLSGVTGLTRKS